MGYDKKPNGPSSAKKGFWRLQGLLLMILLLVITGCSAGNKNGNNNPEPAGTAPSIQTTQELPPTIQTTQELPPTIRTPQELPPYTEPPRETVEDTGTVSAITEYDWSGYFDGMNGAAVIYDPDEEQYMIYNQELVETRRSPCSTFKIISSLIAMEDGIIEPEHSVREWSGEIFWNEKWNKDIDFHEAFRTSCVWYYRQIIDEVGADRIQAVLNGLLYGNCDISDWEGRLNTNNDNRALTGFWIESSLKISAKEQTQVMERIFGRDTHYGEETLEQLKQVMLVTQQDEAVVKIYGKTGMGKDKGIVVDSWFTGFADTPDGRRYFCVYIGRSDGRAVSSAKAKEIAVNIVSDVCNTL